MNKIIKFLTNNESRFRYLSKMGFYNHMPDDKYIKKKYKAIFNKKLDLDNPQTFNEKLQWLKINNRKDIYTTMVDKYKVKEYISAQVGEKYVVPTLGIYDKFDDIEFDKLPNQFVIKCTHDSGGIIICNDKSKLDRVNAKKIITKSLKRNFYLIGREWPYKNVKPRIIIEPLLHNKNGDGLIEFNMFCFNGIPKIIMVCYGDKKKNRYNDFYDENFKRIKMGITYKYSDQQMQKPSNYYDMIKISKIISKDIPFLRVDFYLVDNEIKLGELTFFHWSGFGKFYPQEYDYKFGQLLDINTKRKDK